MIGDNNTPFGAIGFEQMHRDGRRMAVVAARVSYALTIDGRLERIEGAELALSDTYDGPPATSPLIVASDLVPFRPFGDVTLLGASHAPKGAESASWTVGLRVGETARVLNVTGSRAWEPRQGRGFVLGAPKPCRVAPLDYRHAAGGSIIGAPRPEVDPRNPAGTGMLDAKYTSPLHSYGAPAIEDPADPVHDPFARPEPVGFGPLAPSWQPRLRFAGTYDDAWRQSHHPRLPGDFDYRFHQVSPSAQWQPGYLQAGAPVALGRLIQGGGRLDFAIPDEEPFAIFKWIDGREVMARMNRDGLHIDMRGQAPWRADITFRVWIEVCPRFYKADVEFTTARGAAPLPGCGESGLMEPMA
jgi:hypothetical protein